MEHFLVELAGVGTAVTPVTWAATKGFEPVRDDRGALFLDGVVFRLSRDEPHLGNGVGPALLARVRERGPEALAEVVGDFVAVVTTGDEVHAWKSFTSQYQLYVDVEGARIANRLAAAVGARAPAFDEAYFARHVLLVPGLPFHMERTPIQGVSRVLPGELVRLRAGAVTRTQLVTRRYRYKIDGRQRREDVAPEIARLLRLAVTDHLATPQGTNVSVELSGGLDSSFVACLVGEARPGARAVMFSRPDVPSHRESEGYARSVAERYALDLVVLGPEDLPREPTLASPPLADEPSDFFWFGDLFSRAVAAQTEVGGSVFTGFGADQLFLRSPSFLPYLLGRRSLRTFASSLLPAARLLSRSPLDLALQSAWSQIPRGLYYRMARPFAGRRWNPLDVGDVDVHRTLYEPVPWLPASRDQEDFEAERLAAEARLVGDGIVCDDWGYFAASRAVAGPHFEARRLTDASPYCDLRLLDFVYGEVSALLVHDFRGRYKELLREAQRGVVPEDLRARKNDMFVFNAFLGDYLRQGRDELVAMLDEIPDGFVDRAGARRAFEELSFGLMTSSTRSMVALLGYQTWKRGFLAELGRTNGKRAHTS
jgi:asparagine synthase (glutamine-hydrolysing)